MPSRSYSEPSESTQAASSAASSSSSASSSSTGATSGAYNGPSSVVPVNRANGDFKKAKADMTTNLFDAHRNKVFNPPNKEDTGVVIARQIHSVNNALFKPKSLPKAPHIIAKMKRL